jgi:hypothetical protein
MDGTPDKTKILLRRGNKAAPGQFEQLIREIVRQSSHLEALWMMPEPNGGPGAAFNRDNLLVASSDLVLAFFAPYHEMEGGTGHVVEAAVDRNVPVYSFTVDDKALTRVGDHDPGAIWQQTVEAYFNS